ncbi:MAG: hypothetical protein Kapaf2KO_14350 [Candidatus Kapaibacteriales bacterium]
MKKTITILIIVYLLVACRSNDANETPKVISRVPEGNISRVEFEDGKYRLDSITNSSSDDIAPILDVRDLNQEGFLNFCDEDFIGKTARPSIIPSKYITKSDFRKKQDPLYFFSYLTDYIESVSFINKYEGYIALSHPPSEDYARNAGLKIENIKGGTDIFHFKINDSYTAFEEFEGLSLNTDYWDSHPFASTQIIENDTVTLLIWSSDFKQDKGFMYAKDLDGNEISLSDTDLYFTYIVNGKQSREATRISGGVSKEGSNQGSPFAHCLCFSENFLFYSSNEKGNFDIYYSKIKADFEKLDLKVISDPVELDSEYSDHIIKSKGKDGKTILDTFQLPKSYNSSKNDRFPFVLNRPFGQNPRIYLSSKRLDQRKKDSDSTYISSLGGYDIYSFELDSSFVCVEPPKVEPIKEHILQVSVLDAETKQPIPEAIYDVPNAVDLGNGRFKLEAGNCYKAYGGTEASGYELEDDRVVKYYYKSKLEYAFTNLIRTEYLTDEVVKPIAKPYKYKNKLGTTETEIIEKIINHNGIEFKKLINRTMKYAEGFGIDGADFTLKIDVIDTVSYYSGFRIISNQSGFTDEDKAEGLIRGMRSSVADICTTREDDLATTIMYYDTVWLSKSYEPLPKSKLIVSLVDGCNSKRKILKPLIKVATSSGDATIEKDHRLILEIEPEKNYIISGGSEISGLDCNVLPNDILYGYYSYEKGSCDEKNGTLVSGANIPSKLGSVSTFGMLGDTVIYDTIYLKRYTTPKPECTISYDKFRGLNKNVPYFQTAYWEVNTSDNLGDKENSGSHLYFLDGEGYKENGTIGDTKAKFIELHPKSQYFSRWRGENTRLRNSRIEEYKKFAIEVDNNLHTIADQIANERIPQYLELAELSPNGNQKLVIELDAFSDKRPVREGFYIGKETISYTEGNYNVSNGAIELNSIEIYPNSKLGLDNDTLSKLRAWFGYKELIKRLKEQDNFKRLLAANRVYLPDNSKDNPSDYDIIILTKGNLFDIKSNAKIKDYDPENRDESFYKYDSSRRVNITVRALQYIYESYIETDCCNGNNRKAISSNTTRNIRKED